jgi:hypothetical protein
MSEKMTLDQALQHAAKRLSPKGVGSTKKKRTHPEQDEQERLFKWIRAFESEYPDLKFIRGSLNGVPLHPIVAKTAYNMGMRKGEWDVFIDLPRDVEVLGGKYFTVAGMYIEMKWGKNKLTAEQEVFRSLRGRTHEFRVCYSAKIAAECILDYIYDLSIPSVLSRSVNNPLYFVPEDMKQ